MPRNRSLPAIAVATALAIAAAPSSATPATTGGAEVGYATVGELQSEDRRTRRRAADLLVDAGDSSLVPGIVDALFFTPRDRRGEIVDVLEALTGAELGTDYYGWIEWVGAHPEVTPKEGYLEWKASQLARIDPNYPKVLYPGAPSRIRLEEVVWGGVRIGGIPALVSPSVIPGAVADYLEDDELVFGVALGGEARAYPLRVMDWHEMANDVVGGEPVALSYCTLCRSGILYSTKTPSGEARTFGTSGLLYRSNKLMIDQATLTLWSNITGDPVIGRLAQSPVALDMLPMTLTTWRDWLADHPATTVLDLAPLRRQHPFRYVPGAADQAREGVSFPVWQADERLPRKAEVYALVVDGAPKAYPVELLLELGVVNDAVGGSPVVLVADADSGAVRCYRRGERRFRGADDGGLVDEEGRRWSAGEDALLPPGDADPAELAPLERLPGHVAFWFGWYGFYPQTEVYGGEGTRGEERGTRGVDGGVWR